jgi:hypothetical protein
MKRTLMYHQTLRARRLLVLNKLPTAGRPFQTNMNNALERVRVSGKLSYPGSNLKMTTTGSSSIGQAIQKNCELIRAEMDL